MAPCVITSSKFLVISNVLFPILPVQEEFLGTYNNEQVVVIKDFVRENQNYVAFNDLGVSSIEEDRERFQYTYDDIMRILNSNNNLDNSVCLSFQ